MEHTKYISYKYDDEFSTCISILKIILFKEGIKITLPIFGRVIF